MAISQAMCTSFKIELLTGTHDFTPSTGDSFYIALYTSSATLSAATTAYSATNEVSDVDTQYTAGGKLLTVSTAPTNTGGGTTAYLSFSNVTWSGATITARGALIYNASKSNKAVAVLLFDADKTSTAGDFTVVFPTADENSAIIRIA